MIGRARLHLGARCRGGARGLIGLIAGGLLAATAPPASAQIPASYTQRLLVPAYFEPGASYDGWSGRGWSQLVAAPQVGIIVFNPADGPGTRSMVATYRSSIIAARAAGKKVIGYVKTAYGARPLVEVFAEIDAYRELYRDDAGNPLVDGVFVDEVELAAREVDPTAWSNQYKYFAAVRDRIKAGGAAALAVLNPGTGQDFGITELGDIVVAFEGDAAAFDVYSPDPWQADVAPERICSLVFGAGSKDLPAAIANAKSVNHGWIYVTPDYLSGDLVNPWDTLPGGAYWSNERSLVAGTAASRLPPSITAASARDDAGTVVLELSHVFANTGTTGRYRRAFLDTDQNRATGYAVGPIGADFLVENAGLWRWTGAAWAYVTAAAPSPDSSTQTGWRVSRRDMGNPTGGIRVKLDIEEPIARTPVNRYSPLLTVPPAGGAPAYGHSNDATRVYYFIAVAGTYSYRHVFLDTDQRASTGYAVGGIGADYMIENSTLYRSAGAGWSWTAVRSANQVCGNGRCDFSVPRGDIGETKASGEATTLVFHASGASPEYLSIPVVQAYSP